MEGKSEVKFKITNDMKEKKFFRIIEELDNNYTYWQHLEDDSEDYTSQTPVPHVLNVKSSKNRNGVAEIKIEFPLKEKKGSILLNSFTELKNWIQRPI